MRHSEVTQLGSGRAEAQAWETGHQRTNMWKRACRGEARGVGGVQPRARAHSHFTSSRGTWLKVLVQGVQSLNFTSSLVGFPFFTNLALVPHSFHKFPFAGGPSS